MCEMCAKLVPKVLSMIRNKGEFFIDQQLQEEGFLDRVIMSDEWWIYNYNPETKNQVKNGSSKERLGRKKNKEELIKYQNHADHLFYNHRVDHHEFAPPGQTVNAAFYDCFETAT